eukprot:SAG31_NODE_33024_length_348_cov_22.192771_1_plen_35_part_10
MSREGEANKLNSSIRWQWEGARTYSRFSDPGAARV